MKYEDMKRMKMDGIVFYPIFNDPYNFNCNTTHEWTTEEFKDVVAIPKSSWSYYRLNGISRIYYDSNGEVEFSEGKMLSGESTKIDKDKLIVILKYAYELSRRVAPNQLSGHDGAVGDFFDGLATALTLGEEFDFEDGFNRDVFNRMKETVGE